MRKVVADTNFLLMPFEYGIDMPGELIRIIHEPITLIIPSGVIKELKAIAGRTGQISAGARFILQHLYGIKRFPIEIVESTGKVDEWIIKYARQNRVTVATNDMPLRRRLLALEVPVVAMKGKTKLDFV